MLPYDVARCQGAQCRLRESCLRHLCLDDIGPRTPVYSMLCGQQFDCMIEVKNKSEEEQHEQAKDY